jgi:general secretion pathway protein J
MRQSRRAQAAFTLLEMLIAMALSVVLLGILTAGTRAVVDEWQDSTNPFETRLERSLILLQLEQALLGAVPHSYVDHDTLEQNVFFEGGTDTISWASTVSPQAKQALTAWQLATEGLDGVVLKSTPAFADHPIERLDAATGTLVLPEVELTLSYLTLDDLGRAEWLEEWSGAERQSLPLAVRLEFAEGTRSDEKVEVVVPLFARQHETIQPVDVE